MSEILIGNNLGLERLNISSSLCITTCALIDGSFIKDYSKEDIGGSFLCQNINLKTIKKCPNIIKGIFNISNNDIIRLEDFPKYIGGSIDMSYNRLESLIGCNDIVFGDLFVQRNNLSNLIGAPKEVQSDFDCSYNEYLTSLEGCPEHIGGYFICSNNKNIKNLYGLKFKSLVTKAYFDHSGLTSIIGIHKAIPKCIEMHFDGNSIEVGGIGLLLIEGLEKIVFEPNRTETKIDSVTSYRFAKAITIIKKYLNQGKTGLLLCANELEDVGLSSYAKL